MFLLLALMQTADPDEVVIGPRLFAKPECRRQLADEEILVCGAREPDRLARTAPRPDPLTVDRRPKIRVADGLCLRVGFAMTLAAC
ncbi:hypothetical protein E5A73_18015 [Sphingomonas gei]|uniref:Uncharacterized protein n=1 Tax=Sphingomonas gei TaxID=1395960 RepID=A0A4S1X3J1_9SPHN|nr:hypothetical protein [Sphingomonas gei]TGX50313.1 hypothetical protein E5A73_18015 [Sphingomonas gei]